MRSKPHPPVPKKIVAQYCAAVAATPGLELKGAAMPYTSVNGNMHSFLDKFGVAAIRLGDADRAVFAAKFGGGPYVHEAGAVMKEYVSLPAPVLADTKATVGWLKKSFVYAKTLKTKATIRKTLA